MTSRKVKKAARVEQHAAMMKAFTAWLDGYWPDWREDQDTQRFTDIKASFRAGWDAA